MAIYEKNGVFNYLDASGNQNILYPVTKSDNVDGLDDELALKVNVADVVNNLTSSDTNKPLSAKQGKALQDGKQAKLVSGTNIKTINGVSILGSGDMTTPLPTASASTLGGVKIGSGINVTSEGVISAQSYSLPTASASVKGGIKIGSGLSISNEVVTTDTNVVQAKLVSGTNIKTINSTSLLGNGDITITSDLVGVDFSNCLYSASRSDVSYTATQDGWLFFGSDNGYGIKQITFGGLTITIPDSTTGFMFVAPIKKGQTVAYAYGNLYVHVYAIKK